MNAIKCIGTYAGLHKSLHNKFSLSLSLSLSRTVHLLIALICYHIAKVKVDAVLLQ